MREILALLTASLLALALAWAARELQIRLEAAGLDDELKDLTAA